MKKFVLAFILNLTTLIYSQQEANVWYFGNNAGLDFNSGSPVALLNGQLDTQESCGSIADTSGQLLFYTDGMSVFNRNHVVMPNGSGLLGQSSSSQSGTIVPAPGSTTLFYIFTTDREGHPNGFRYSVVDMSLNGGLGDVTTVKNVLVFTPSLECISVVSKGNNIDYWVVVHGFNNNKFFSYSLTNAGLSATPVESAVGTAITGSGFDAAAVIKIAPSGSKLAFTSVTDVAQLFDFDNNTGVVSNPITLSTETGELYGIEFSPNENVLYIVNSFYKVYQYDLLAANIPNSKITLYNGPDVPGQLQLGPDGKIYIANYGKGKLGVISNPNVVGLGCDLQMQSFDLSGRISSLGLPSFNRSYFTAGFTATNFCEGTATQFTLSTTQNINSVNWDFGDGSPISNSFNPSHLYANAGTYTVTMNATGAGGTISKSKVITILALPIVAGTVANQNLCSANNSMYNLAQHNAVLLGSQSPSVFGVAYFASMTDATNHANVLASNHNLAIGNNILYAKVYNLTNNDCYSLSNFTIGLFSSPVANIPNDIFICDDVTNDGLGMFNLQSVKASVLGNQNSSNFNVSFYLNQNDADSNNSPLALNYQNISNPQMVYVRVENNQNTICFATTSFQIGLYSMPIIANQPNNLYACDDGNGGVELFNLGQQTAAVLGAQPTADFEVTYHSSQNDANTGNNALPNNFLNTVTPQTVYIRAVNRLSNACYVTTSFQLIVKEEPNLAMVDTYTICEGHPIVITVPAIFSDYNWTTGSLTSSSIITTAGNYSVTVIEDYGSIQCSTTKDFVVYNSNVATITDIEISDWTDEQNVITVEAMGDGDYQFSLDGIVYQDSNVFPGLRSGQYTVYIRDKKGCGTVTDSVFLLMYPRYFTPNGDGVNDTWQIKFSMTEPQMELSIFDRYGKLLTQFKGLDFGWDGTLNGKLLFADDYWFVVKRKDGKEFKGHFSLLR